MLEVSPMISSAVASSFTIRKPGNCGHIPAPPSLAFSHARSFQKLGNAITRRFNKGLCDSRADGWLRCLTNNPIRLKSTSDFKAVLSVLTLIQFLKRPRPPSYYCENQTSIRFVQERFHSPLRSTSVTELTRLPISPLEQLSCKLQLLNGSRNSGKVFESGESSFSSLRDNITQLCCASDSHQFVLDID